MRAIKFKYYYQWKIQWKNLNNYFYESFIKKYYSIIPNR